jgi:hypothetical protein
MYEQGAELGRGRDVVDLHMFGDVPQHFRTRCMNPVFRARADRDSLNA